MPAEGPILIAYDGSEQAREAIRQAGDQLKPDRKAIVLAVWEPVEAIPFWGAPVSQVPPSLTQQVEEEAAKAAAEGAELAKAAGFDAESGTVEGAPIWKAIVEAAEGRGASLIVMGSHGRTGLGFVAMGSVATAVAHHAEIPVLICRQPH
ncbi:MAG: universal stress protein [Solirubrobacterales bacterium]